MGVGENPLNNRLFRIFNIFLNDATTLSIITFSMMAFGTTKLNILTLMTKILITTISLMIKVVTLIKTYFTA
jgi:hypothetical protein